MKWWKGVMDGSRYIEVPGDQTHELPPLVVHAAPDATPVGEVLGMAAEIVESEDMIPVWDNDLEHRKHELAINLAEQYHALVAHWAWGDSIVEWIRQCEITFEMSATLRSLLHPDVWPTPAAAVS